MKPVSDRVLHVPFTYFPDAIGGTEVYVNALVGELRGHGYTSYIAAPSSVASRYIYNDVQVLRFATDPRPRLELAYGVPDAIAASNFAAVLEELKPAIVHLHARTSAISEQVVDIAHASGARVVFTYHTPTVSCARGTMMSFGKSPCDGLISKRHCVACALNGNGVPRTIAEFVARLPDSALATAAVIGNLSAILSQIRSPFLIASQRQRFLNLMSKVDHIVAVCEWVRNVLLTNGINASKMTLSRQGVSVAPPAPPAPSAERSRSGKLRIAYFGRIDRAKGPDLLAEALQNVTAENIAIDIYAVRQHGSERDYDALVAFACKDNRLTLRPAVAVDQVQATMSQYDLVAVPSRWLETGPLVVLEAFAAGVPIMGADLGGIAELVHDGIDGILVSPDDVAAWSQALTQAASDTGKIDQMRANVRPPRTMAAVALDMARLYASLAVPPPIDAKHTFAA